MHLPAGWDLAHYRFDRKSASVRMDDAEAVRLELEWTRPRGKLKESTIRDRYREKAKSLDTIVREARVVDNLPGGWHAVLHTMPHNRCLVTAYWLAPRERFFCFAKMHFEATGSGLPIRVLRHLADTFELSADPVVRWEVYDVQLRLHRKFQLMSTSFEAGRKLFVFQRRLRRLYIWQFSLADILLRDRRPCEWAAEYLNSCKDLRGVRFTPGDSDDVVAKRKRRYPAGHYDEIGRLCFRYQVDCVHDPGRNIVLLCVYNYRKATDLVYLKSLRESFTTNVPDSIDNLRQLEKTHG